MMQPEYDNTFQKASDFKFNVKSQGCVCVGGGGGPVYLNQVWFVNFT